LKWGFYLTKVGVCVKKWLSLILRRIFTEN
jgi:hypothetical protein